MSEAIILFYKVLQIIVSWLFSAELVSGVSIGWVFVSVAIFGILIRSILNVPESSNRLSLADKASRNYYYKKQGGFNIRTFELKTELKENE